MLKKIDEQSAKTRVEKIYDEYCAGNKEAIERGIQAAVELKKKALQQRTGGLDGRQGAKKYENPFTALKIDNTKKLHTMGEDQASVPEKIESEQAEKGTDLMYNDGTLSPLVIPFEEAGYLQALAVTDEQIIKEQEALMKEYLVR